MAGDVQDLDLAHPAAHHARLAEARGDRLA
jgi:hypothetical protein